METTETAPVLNTKFLMVSSALLMGLLGLGASFVPQEILSYVGAPTDGFSVVVMEITGALYLGFAFLNWMARGNIIGGIYSRPVALGNFLHFFLVTVVLLEEVLRGQAGTALIALTVPTAVFAGCFGYLLYGYGEEETFGAACG